MEIKWNKLAVKQLLDTIEYLENNEQLAYAEKIEKETLAKNKIITRKTCNLSARQTQEK